MTTEKKHLLDKTFQTFLELGLKGENLDLLPDMVAKDVVGFGTTIDEKIFGLKELLELLIRQKEQSAGLEMNWKPEILDIHISVDENTAIYINETILYVTVDGNTIEMYIRVSVVLEYVQHKWMVVHWHASKPEQVESEKDTWGVQSWKEKAEELEKEVAARTADLVEKNRELKIEAALEKVRARSSAMQQTHELGEVISIIFQKLDEFDISVKDGVALITFIEGSKDLKEWMANPGFGTAMHFLLPYFNHPILYNLWEAKSRGEDILIQRYSAEESRSFLHHIFEHSDFKHTPQPVKDYCLAAETYATTIAFQKHTAIFINDYSGISLTSLEIDLLKRFSIVFEQTYTRFLDLQKAEAQAREAQIEAALERVRSRSMAMHKSDELKETVFVMYEQLQQLNFDAHACNIIIADKNSGNREFWVAGFTEKIYPESYKVPYIKHPYVDAELDAWKRGDKYLTFEYEGKMKQDFDAIFFSQSDFKNTPEEAKSMMMNLASVKFSIAFFTYGSVQSLGKAYLSEENANVLQRFALVFEQTYTRFLDLQKAEAQAREAQIEAALERVRSRSMAMHKSDELRSVVNTLYGELQSLQVNFHVVGIQLLPDQSMDLHMWLSTADGLYDNIIHWPFTDLPAFHEIYKARTTGDMLEYTMSESTMKEFFKEYFKLEGVPQGRKVATQNVKLIDLCGAYQHLTGIFLMRYSEGNYSSYEKDIVNRFSKAFEQTYTRFLDLQKAEAQARAAQIESALEKVRSRSLAMQSPNELIEVAQLLREEMGALGVEALETSSIYIYDENSGTTQCWFTIKNADNSGKAITDQMTIDLHETWVGKQMYAFYKSAEKQISIRMQGVQRIEWIRYCEEKSDLFGTSNFYGDTIPERTYHLVKFTNGFMGAAAPGEISKESRELLKRATAVFSFAYTRFRDLQMAEASARASLRQASLDRVRADISSMRHADDLSRITPLVFNELTTLGIPFIRCGVFIVHEKSKNVQVYLSTPEGKSLAAMNLPFDANELTTQSVAAWKKEDVFIQHWNQADFIHWGKSLQEQGHVKDMKTYQDAEAAPESLHLHFIPFTQGLLYVGSTETLAHEQIDLVKALAKSFAIAYARYEDFVKLEAAKAAVESAMDELKSTQAQLVQQEKLASLGQLTAGIAHEIKNPLNFVNNFSEVSLELIDESLEEMNRGPETRDETIVNENLAHIKSNIIKVLDHGTRANSIVNSMLMHSRQGSGKAEPTMLNDFIREYSNLAYHGMRAGNHPLDVQMNFNLDKRVKEVPLIAEDFSRVVLNICNNAFDAMRSTLKPTLTISTQLQDDSIIIQFEDNGSGIPDDIKDKILQPFFTTKKGTEGTGLGLSISHDIVKAHGGVLKLETQVGNGSIFIIQIPINTNNG